MGLLDPSEDVSPVYKKAHTMCSKVSFCKLHEVRKQNVYLNPGVSACTTRQIYRPVLNWLSPKQDEVSVTFCDGARGGWLLGGER